MHDLLDQLTFSLLNKLQNSLRLNVGIGQVARSVASFQYALPGTSLAWPADLKFGESEKLLWATPCSCDLQR